MADKGLILSTDFTLSIRMGMNDTEFLQRVDTTLRSLEETIECLADNLDIDVDISRQGYVLTIDFEASGKVIVNAQAAVQELWVAAKSGGFHYRWDGATWRNTREGTEWRASLSAILSAQLGQAVVLP